MMPIRRSLFVVLSLLALVVAVSAATRKKPVAAPAAAMNVPANADTAIFAGGCFWSMETNFENVPGVYAAISGYTGGKLANPSYEDVSTQTTGHYESIEVLFDPKRITYEQLLERYWHGIDPTQADGQLYDIGPEYRTVIFTRTPAQRAAALASKAAIEKSGVLKRPIVTQILAATPFYPAEEYHQDYARKNPEHYNAYRTGSRRDERTFEIWGKAQTLPIHHGTAQER